MSDDIGITIRCQRCGTFMEMRDPAPGGEWRPEQFWVCSRCGRHFWTTYPPPAKEKPTAAPAAAKPESGSSPPAGKSPAAPAG